MSGNDAKAKAEAFKLETQTKIRALLDEFAEGQISREQFHVLYERYSGRLAITEYAILSGSPEAVSIAQGGPPTIAVREEYMGKAIGMMIYHNKSGTVVETLGNFDVPVSRVSARLNDISAMMEAGELIDRQLEKIGNRRWLVFVAGRYTTVVTLFHNEPSQRQSREIERLHHDFEQANRVFLERGQLDGKKLAYPFVVFIQQKLKK